MHRFGSAFAVSEIHTWKPENLLPAQFCTWLVDKYGRDPWKAHWKYIWKFCYLTFFPKSSNYLDCLGCWQPTLHYKSTGAPQECKSELIICNTREGRQSSGQPYSAHCRTFQLSELFTNQEYSWYRLSQMAYITELFIFKWITAKLHPWEVFTVHTVLWKSSPAWQSVTCMKHMVIKSTVRDSNCKLCTFKKLQ